MKCRMHKTMYCRRVRVCVCVHMKEETTVFHLCKLNATFLMKQIERKQRNTVQMNVPCFGRYY